MHAKQWLQSLTWCLCKTHSESSSQYWQQTSSFLPTRDKESQSQSPKALELSDDSCIHVGHVLLCPSKGGWAGATGGHFQPVLTWPDCQRNNYATIKYATRYTRTPMIGSSGANVSKENHGSSGSAYTRAFSRLANVLKQSIINCPNDGNVASMPELCHRYLLLLEGMEGVWCCTVPVSEPDVPRPNSTGLVVKNGVLQFLWMNQLALPNALQFLSCKCQLYGL